MDIFSCKATYIQRVAKMKPFSDWLVEGGHINDEQFARDYCVWVKTGGKVTLTLTQYLGKKYPEHYISYTTLKRILHEPE
jgi:hypothetical protein